jgi:hypothetical protein
MRPVVAAAIVAAALVLALPSAGVRSARHAPEAALVGCTS